MSTPNSTVTDTTDIDPCLSCDTTTRMQPDPSAVPKVQAWAYAAWGTRWAITATNPRLRPWLGHLAEDSAAIRSVLGGVITLAEQAPEISDDQFRFRSRLAALTVPAQRARKVSLPQAPKPPHGLLFRLHAGCRCRWCLSRARAKTCGCDPCLARRANTYFWWPE